MNDDSYYYENINQYNNYKNKYKNNSGNNYYRKYNNDYLYNNYNYLITFNLLK